ncbi:MAG: trypsin-like peptidase domain-containing protein [Candidatus Symbiothrix sp.]|nr:trypsin-like peptidase domain-containing protein [Candidatus Symbiothrix sp.]
MKISKVVHAYYNLFSPEKLGDSNQTCHNDINCYLNWKNESDAVVLVLLATGTEWCSGSLLNNTKQDYRPYFLSAFHCIDTNDNGTLSSTEINAAENWEFRFQFKKIVCNGSSVTNYISYNHATFRAAWVNTDFLLMELVDAVTNASGQLTLLGWDKSGNTPSSATGIHHPSGDVMKISFDNHSLGTNSSVINWTGSPSSPSNTHWVVGFDNGTTEGGSSGSPLFDQNKRVVGQLHGGATGCAPITKYYGKFNLSWTGGGTDSTRLSNWLDPSPSTSATTVNTIRTPVISGNSYVCTNGNVFTLENLPSGATVQWSVSGTAFTLSNQTNSSVKVTKTGLNESQATLTALINNSAVVTTTLTPCQLYIYSYSPALCSSAVFSIANLPSFIIGSQISWSCSSNLSLVGGTTGLTKTVNVLSVGDGTGWVEINVNQQLVKRSYLTILQPNNNASISGQSSITQSSSANYTLFSITDPIETYIPNSGTDLESCSNVTWTSSSNLSISPGAQGSSDPDEEIDYRIPISVYASGSGSGWIKAQITVNGSTLYVQKNIQIVPNSISVSITDHNYYFHATTSPQANLYTWRFNSNIIGVGNYADLYYFRENNNSSIVNTLQVTVSNGSLSGASQITVYGSIVVESEEVEDYISCYPNPVSSGSMLNISVDMTKYSKSRNYLQAAAGDKSKVPAFSVKLCSNAGIALRQSTLGNGSTQLNVSGLSPGIYFLLVYDGLNTKPTMHRIVIN